MAASTRLTPEPAASDPGTSPRALSERLRVLEVGPERLHLAATRAAACATCAAKAGCGAAALGSLDGFGRGERLVLPRPPGLPVAVGDMVEVELSGNAFLAAAGLAYLLPMLALIAAVVLAQAMGWPDPVMALAAIIALALGLVPLVLAERRGRLAQALRIVAVHPAGRDTPQQVCGPQQVCRP